MASQRDIGGVALVRDMHMVEAHLVARCSFAGALNECLRHDGRDDHAIATAIHVSKGYMSKLLRCVWSAQSGRLVAFMRETRCLAPLQWMADQVGCELRPKKSALEEELDATRARLADLERRAAA